MRTPQHRGYLLRASSLRREIAVAARAAIYPIRWLVLMISQATSQLQRFSSEGRTVTVRLIGSAAIAILIGAVLLLGYHAYLARYQPVAAENQHRDPVLIPGINEPEELRVEPVAPSQTKLTAPQQMLADAMNNSGQNSDPTALLPAVNKIIAKYPDYSDAYLMRLGALCNGNDRAAIMSDINNALRFKGDSLVGKDTKSFNSLLSMRGKIEHENGDDRAAMDDLDKAIHADLANASKFANSGGIAPEKTASVCTWTQPDMDAFVQHFPTDYRSYLFRGQRWSRVTGQNGDLAKVDSGFDYAANFSSFACVA